MSRKSTIVTLGILGAVAASLGVCCCAGVFERREEGVERDKDVNGIRHTHRSPRYSPLFRPWGLGPWGGGISRPLAPTGSHPTGAPSSSPRGGFGATGHSSGGGAHGVGA